MKKFIAVVKIWPLPLLGLGVSALISMSRDAILLCCTVVVAVGYQSYSCTAHRIRVDDLAVAASKQQDRWEKGKTSDQHQSNFIDNTHAGKKGYDSERGCILNISFSHAGALFFPVRNDGRNGVFFLWYFQRGIERKGSPRQKARQRRVCDKKRSPEIT